MAYDWKITAWKAVYGAVAAIAGAIIAGIGTSAQGAEIALVVAILVAVQNYAKHNA